MKNKLSNFLKIGILLFGISLLILNCDKDLEIDNPIESSDFVIDVKSLNQEQINPKILSFLASKNGLANKSNSSSKKNDYKALINFDNITQVIDQLGNTNYTFILEVKDNDPATFYNLIVNESQTSTEPHITIHKFVSDPSSLENFINSNYNFEKFNGKILKYNLPNFLSSHTDYLSKSTTAVDDCLCSEIPISGGSGYGSGGSTNPVGGGPGGPISGGGGSDPSNPFDNCDTYMYVQGCGGSNSDAWHLHDSCGFPEDPTSFLPVVVCGGEPDVFLQNKTTKDDCNNPCGGTGSGGTAAILLPLPMSAVTIAEILGIEDGTSEFNWLNNLANGQYRIAISNFLNTNKVNGNFSLESINFAKKYLELSILNIDNLTNEEIESFFNFNQDYKNRMSVSERAIFNNMSKIKQMGYLFNAQKATWRAEELFPNSLYNGKGDAFRHAYFNGLNTILLGLPLAESLATAHEDKPSAYFHDFKEKDMDLFNNQAGRDRANWFQDDFSSLEESILEAMDYGLLRYLSNLQGGGSSGRATNLSVLTLSNN